MQNQDNINNIYTIIKKLGLNGFAYTYLVNNENNHNQYAAKIMKDENQQLFNRELQMTSIISGLNNPNLVHLNEHGNGPVTIKGNVQNRNYLILNYYPKGDLLDYIQIPGHGFTELHAKYIFDKILRGVQAIHGAGICHRDLKLDNILLDQNYNPIICNFDLATNNNVNALNEFIGTINYYSSPQIINHQVYNGFMADIFSLGVILFKLVTNYFAFKIASINDATYALISQQNFIQFWNIMQNIGINPSQLFRNLFERMVLANENNRPTIGQILLDPWFAEIRNLNNIQQAQLETQILNEFVARENQINQNLALQPKLLNQQNEDINNK